MLDIKDVLNKVQGISEIHIVSVKNDCKEILLKLETGATITQFFCVNQESDQEAFAFIKNEFSDYQFTFSEAGNFIYEPNASVMKSGAFKELAAQFSLKKIAPNTHIFTSEHFPIALSNRQKATLRRVLIY